MEQKKINRKELVDEYASRIGITKREARQIIGEVFPLIVELVCEGHKVHLNGFGDFCTVVRKKRGSVDPRTQERIIVEERVVPKFIPGRVFKAEVLKSVEQRTKQNEG